MEFVIIGAITRTKTRKENFKNLLGNASKIFPKTIFAFGKNGFLYQSSYNRGDVRMSKKDLVIKNLDKYRYRELKNLCLQYKKLKKEGKEKSSTKAAAIEKAAYEADEGIATWILLNVTEDINYHYMDAPCSKGYFYKKRRLFFSILDEKI